MWGGGGGESEMCYISAIIGLWKELSKMKVFKKQAIMCIKRLRHFCGIKKCVVRTTHGGQ